MTKQQYADRASMTHAEWMAWVMDVYDVPIDLIRYESTYDVLHEQHTGTNGTTVIECE